MGVELRQMDDGQLFNYVNNQYGKSLNNGTKIALVFNTLRMARDAEFKPLNA